MARKQVPIPMFSGSIFVFLGDNFLPCVLRPLCQLSPRNGKKKVCKGPLGLLEKGHLYFYSLVLHVCISGYKHNSTLS